MPARLPVNLILGLSFLVSQTAGSDAQEKSLLAWQELPELPVSIEGAFVGSSEGVLIVAGGQTTTQKNATENGLSDAVFVLQPDTRKWLEATNLSKPLAYGAAVETEDGLFCFGGTTGSGGSDKAFILRWDIKTNQLKLSSLPNLPEPLSICAATRLGDEIYVAGSRLFDLKAPKRKKCFWSIKVSDEGPRWRSHPVWPGEGWFSPAVVAQSGELFLLGGAASSLLNQEPQSLELVREAYRYSPSSAKWQAIADAPIPMAATPAIAFGPSTILCIGGLTINEANEHQVKSSSRQVRNTLLAYETTTDTWCERGEYVVPVALTTAVKWQNQIVLVGGRTANNSLIAKVIGGSNALRESAFHLVDYIVLSFYFILLLSIGWYFSASENTSNDYLLGDRKIPWWAVGLSIMATQVSSIGFMALPAKSFSTDWVYFTGVLTWFLVVPLVVRFYLPFLFFRPNAVTAYEYLECRFNLLARLYGSSSFVMLQLGRMAIVLYLPAIALSVVTGMNVYVSILVMGTLSTGYTVLGGINAVIWTDVLQAIVLVGGALLGVGIAILEVDGGFNGFISIAHSHEKFRLVNWDTSITTTALWIILIGNVFKRTSDLTADQAVVQRYLTTGDLRKASNALWCSAIASIPWAILVFLFGTALFAFYKTHPENMSPSLQPDAIVPWFVVESLPVGISGVVIAALLAAAMSSLDSSIHSVATTISIDFYKRLRPECTDQSLLRLARWLTGILGVLGTAMALLIATYAIESLWDLFLTFAGLAIGGLAGLFALGIFTTRGNSIGAVAGAVVGGVILYFVQSLTPIHFFLYPVIGVGSCFSIGYLVSLLFPLQQCSLEGLTIYTYSQSDSPLTTTPISSG
ncbi:sodium:solute symporter [Adhaeretor mobilis]|uniref:Sodium/glucose cotransporter n=1 Tax=Adhaeretor mobilis TaxID=1930276 RepID=A0A517MW47_9BACT|nr:sodium/solute symporter [Adhaeretor mobilis]QDS99104.1 Sodium/glucose cotransporter [Adhaeretor mobilis]